MKICPNCQRQFPDEYTFCLKDGATLSAFANQDTAIPTVTTTLNFCGHCAAPISNKYPYCQICGTPNGKFEPESSNAGQKPKNEGATSTENSDFVDSFLQDKKKLTIIGAVAAVVLLFVGIIAFNSSNSSTSNTTSNVSTSSNRSNTSNRINSISTSTAYNSSYSNTNNSDSAVVGQTGRLIMDLNLRSAPNKDSLSLGTHYQDAEVKILETTSFDTPSGYSSWYKVRVIRDGCSTEDRSRCGNNRQIGDDFGWMQAEKEGWMNAKYIQIN
jgi:hypothetical protein